MDVRSTEQRKQDALSLLRSEVDCWVPSASADGDAYLVPLSFLWDDGDLIMATPRNSVTARNLLRAGRARVAVGPTRDVVIIEGTVDSMRPDSDHGLADRHAQAAGFDARSANGDYIFLRVRPERIQAWRNPAELANRDVMRDGAWLS